MFLKSYLCGTTTKSYIQNTYHSEIQIFFSEPGTRVEKKKYDIQKNKKEITKGKVGKK